MIGPREMFPWYRIAWNLFTAPLVLVAIAILFMAVWIHHFSIEDAKDAVRGIW